MRRDMGRQTQGNTGRGKQRRQRETEEAERDKAMSGAGLNAGKGALGVVIEEGGREGG